MEERNRFIDPKRMGTWLVVALGTALVALILAAFSIREARLGAMVTQVEVIKLLDRIQALER
jgi:hypothetical protein